ncbi:hypothetical protein V1504DRAFT_475196 [Lipomyces starkeyi]
MEDFDSSDVEYEPATNPFPNAGARSLEQILQHAVVDRLESKKRLKQLNFVQGSKGTQYANHLWYTRFTGFCSMVLKVDDTTTPTADQIERFISSIVSRVVPRSSQVPSYRWLQQGLGHLVNSLVFYFKDFTLSKHETVRIAATINQLFEEGKLSKDPLRQRHHIGALLVRKLALGLLTDALTNGTINWDVVLAKTLSIVLTAALGTRTGDITKGYFDVHQLPFLCHKDITLKLIKGDDLTNLVAKVVIRNEKGYKGDGTNNREVTLKTLKDNKDNTVCPIKLLLILALRLGNVHARTIDEVLHLAAERSDKTIHWVYPQRPVLCSFRGPGAFIQPDKPAGSKQLTQTMAEAGPKGGFLARIRPHDLRRGAARDAANLSHSIKGYATPAVAAVIGHSEQSHMRGSTAKYVGFVEETWSKRVEENFDDYSFEIDVTGESFVKRRRTSQSEITEMCKNAGLDSSDANNRKKMGRMNRERTLEDCIASPIPHPLFSHFSQGQLLTSREALAEWTPSKINETANGDSKKQLKRTDANSVASSVEQTAEHAPRVPITVFIDPRLLTGAIELEDQGGNDGEPSFTPAIEEVYFDEIVSPPPETVADELRIDGLEFVRHFSKINVSTNQTIACNKAAKDDLVASVYSGNSRDQLSLWQFSCKNVAFGCSYRHSFYAKVLEHQRVCKIISTEAFAELNEVKAFLCDRDGCRKSFKLHSAYAPTKCQYPGCTSQVSFASSNTYRVHLLRIHGLTDRKEKDKYMPGKKPSLEIEDTGEFEDPYGDDFESDGEVVAEEDEIIRNYGRQAQRSE